MVTEFNRLPVIGKVRVSQPIPPLASRQREPPSSAALRTGRKPRDLPGSHHSTLTCKTYFSVHEQKRAFLT